MGPTCAWMCLVYIRSTSISNLGHFLTLHVTSPRERAVLGLLSASQLYCMRQPRTYTTVGSDGPAARFCKWNAKGNNKHTTKFNKKQNTKITSTIVCKVLTSLVSSALLSAVLARLTCSRIGDRASLPYWRLRRVEQLVSYYLATQET